MQLRLILFTGLKEIRANKFRSVLTMLGVILGVASLLSMLALTAGMEKGAREYMTQVGGIERVSVIQQEVPAEQEHLADISPGRTLADAEAIRKSACLVARVTPLTDLFSCVIQREGQSFRTLVNGVWPDYIPMTKHEVEFGRSLSHLDVERAHRVCVIGRRTVEQLWPGQANYNPVGESIALNGRPFQVIGVFQFYEREEDRRRRELAARRLQVVRRDGSRSVGRGWNMFADRKNSTILIPVTTMLYEFKSANIVNNQDQGPNFKLDNLIFQVADTSRFQQTLDQVRAILQQTHRGVDDFAFDTREESFDAMERGVRNARLSGGVIAGISLLVGGIGITNIMLASVTERVREIGVRKAVGAKGRDILVQILVESAVIGVIGGLLGLLASAGIMQLLVMVSPVENAPIVDLASILLSFGFAVIVGVSSGLYPAFKASRLDPIEALRYG